MRASEEFDERRRLILEGYIRAFAEPIGDEVYTPDAIKGLTKHLPQAHKISRDVLQRQLAFAYCEFQTATAVERFSMRDRAQRFQQDVAKVRHKMRRRTPNGRTELEIILSAGQSSRLATELSRVLDSVDARLTQAIARSKGSGGGEWPITRWVQRLMEVYAYHAPAAPPTPSRRHDLTTGGECFAFVKAAMGPALGEGVPSDDRLRGRMERILTKYPAAHWARLRSARKERKRLLARFARREAEGFQIFSLPSMVPGFLPEGGTGVGIYYDGFRRRCQ